MCHQRLVNVIEDNASICVSARVVIITSDYLSLVSRMTSYVKAPYLSASIQFKKKKKKKKKISREIGVIGKRLKILVGSTDHLFSVLVTCPYRQANLSAGPRQATLGVPPSG